MFQELPGLASSRTDAQGAGALSRQLSLAAWLVWHLLSVLLLVLIPHYLRLESTGGRPLWLQPFFVALGVTYFVIAVALTIATRKGHRLRFAEAAHAVALPLAGFALYLLFSEPAFSRKALLTSLMLVPGFACASLALSRRLQAPALIVLAAVALMVLPQRGETTVRPDARSRAVASSVVNLLVTTYPSLAGVSDTNSGGAISRFGKGVLLAAADGSFHYFEIHRGARELPVRTIGLRVPMNRDAALDYVTRNHISFRPGTMFRVADILVQEHGQGFRLFAAHHYWNSDLHCFTVRVSSLDGTYAAAMGGEWGGWETLFDSSPCIPLTSEKQTLPLDHLLQSGGKLELIGPQKLLLTVGDHEFDGVNAPKDYPQDPTASYGKTILIDLNARTSSVYTMGHRSPEGLHADASGRVWLTEHGPQGGDELNLLREGANYGWPLVTYGTEYGQLNWPLSAQQNRHDGFEQPTYAWTPSIGVSSLIEVRGSLFSRWKGDLLVSSLRDESLWRLRTHMGHVVLAERIRIRQRIRDLLEDESGRVVLLTESFVEGLLRPAIVIVEPVASEGVPNVSADSAAERGALVFARCSGCHPLATGTMHGIGPDLRGVLHRDIAAANGYAYSDAMKRLPGTWSEKSLDEFLAAPAGYAPGTVMKSEGVPDPGEREDLIAFLRGGN